MINHSMLPDFINLRLFLKFLLYNVNVVGNYSYCKIYINSFQWSTYNIYA